MNCFSVGGCVPGIFIRYGTSSSQNEYTTMVNSFGAWLGLAGIGGGGMAGGRLLPKLPDDVIDGTGGKGMLWIALACCGYW